MKSFLISDNKDTLVAMRLAGIDGVILHERDEVLSQISECIKNKEIGILVLTENIFELVEGEVMELKLKLRTPLFVEIPDRFGTKRDENYILKSISESIGIKI